MNEYNIIIAFILRQKYQNKYNQNFVNKSKSTLLQRRKNKKISFSAVPNSIFVKFNFILKYNNNNELNLIINKINEKCNEIDYVILFSRKINKDSIETVFVGLDSKISELINSINYFFLRLH